MFVFDKDLFFKLIGESEFTYRELSQQAGLSPSAINRISSGHVKNPGIDTVLSVCNAANIDPRVLLHNRK